MDCDERILSQAGGMSIVPCLFGTRGKWPETLSTSIISLKEEHPKVPKEPHALRGRVYSSPGLSEIIAVILDTTASSSSNRVLSPAVMIWW